MEIFDTRSVEKELDAAILERSDQIEAEIIGKAKALCALAYDAIKIQDASRKRKPSCTLSVRYSKQPFDTRFVWVSFSIKKKAPPDGSITRFTTEIPGRKDGKYPKTIFRSYYPELREYLSDIEGQCAVLPGKNVLLASGTHQNEENSERSLKLSLVVEGNE